MSTESADVRRRILDASIALVAAEGVRAVSFREVARRLGVSHQAPYHHFGNHHGILRAIAQEGFASLTSAMREAAGRHPGDPHAALREAGVAYVDFACTHVGHFRVMFQGTLVDIHSEEDPLPEAEGTYATLVELAARAHAAGAGRGLPPEGVTLTAWSVVHGLAHLLIEGVLASKGRERMPPREDLVGLVVGGFSRLLGPG